jgi:hypothetical protein
MARSNVVFSGSGGGERHAVQVEGDVEQVVGTLRNGWAQLNRAKEGTEPDWVWVNEARVLYVESVGRSVYERRGAGV